MLEPIQPETWIKKLTDWTWGYILPERNPEKELRDEFDKTAFKSQDKA